MVLLTHYIQIKSEILSLVFYEDKLYVAQYKYIMYQVFFKQ